MRLREALDFTAAISPSHDRGMNSSWRRRWWLLSSLPIVLIGAVALVRFLGSPSSVPDPQAPVTPLLHVETAAGAGLQPRPRAGERL